MRIAQYTTDSTQLLIPVFLRGRGGRYVGSLASAVVTWTAPNGAAPSARSLISRGSGRCEIQLTLDDATLLGTGWADISSSIGAWFDVCQPVEFYLAGSPPPPPPVPTPIQDRIAVFFDTSASQFLQPRSRSRPSVRRR